MHICYNNLFKLLIDRGWSKTEFAHEVGISSNTLAKLSKNEFVSLEVLVRICRRLDCTLSDVAQILPPDQAAPVRGGFKCVKGLRPRIAEGGGAAHHE